jgi:diacylglycerol O-acyltransferase
MDNLGVLDQLFYKADQYKVASVIMGGASILAPAVTGEKLDAQDIASHLAARLENIPLLRKKLVQDPLRIGSVRKVDDPAFDIHDHIFIDSLAKPGGYKQLAQHIAELSAEPLGLTRLWRWTVLDGLAGGKLAVVCKIHHALAYGLGVVEVLSSIYDPKPVAPEKPAKKSRQIADEPTPYALLGDAVAESTYRLFVKTPKFVFKNTAPILSALGNGLREQLANRAEPDKNNLMNMVDATSLNISQYSDKRSMAWRTFSLPEFKTISRHFGCTINDLGLLLFSFALENYFKLTGEPIDFDLWCGVPISTRTETSGSAGNQVTAGRVCLHNTMQDPIERLRAISADAHEAKQAARPEKSLVDMEELGEVLPNAAVDGLLYLSGRFNLMGRLGGKYAVMNALLSNVPGPPATVYVANGAMVESIPMIPAIDVIALSGGIVSVDKAITIGFHCDGETVKDPELFAQGLELGLIALQKAMKPARKKRRKTAAAKSARA